MHKSFPLQCTGAPVVSRPRSHVHEFRTVVHELGTVVFLLRGTTNERVPATIAGSPSKADCAAIQNERSSHSWPFLISPYVLLHMGGVA